MTINFHLFLLLSVKPFWWFPIIVIDEISQTVHGLPKKIIAEFLVGMVSLIPLYNPQHWQFDTNSKKLSSRWGWWVVWQRGGNMVETRQCVHIVVVCTGSSLKSFILCLNDMTTRMVCELLLQALLTLGLSVCRARIRFSDWYCQGRRRSNIWIFVGQNGGQSCCIFHFGFVWEKWADFSYFPNFDDC